MPGGNQQKKEPWRNQERHYCAVCNSWMGSDRQSIMIHENGKKHLEKVEEALQQKRKDKLEEEKESKLLQSTLAQIEAEARNKMGLPANGAQNPNHRAPPHQHQQHHQQHGRQYSAPGGPLHTPFHHHHQMPPGHFPNSRMPQAAMPQLDQIPMPVQSQAQTAVSTPNVTTGPPPSGGRQEWQARREKRKDQYRTKDDDDDEENQDASKQSRKRIKIDPEEGHYSHGETTYLEGQVFFSILEEDLPIQLWSGPDSAGDEEKRLPERDMNWKDAIVAGIVRRLNGDSEPIVHVSYLQSPDDTDETLLKKVPLHRIRLVLGGDERIPNNLEEARLLAMGGEEVKVTEDDNAQDIDEATGLSGWSTVAIKRTTVRQELKEERDRSRQKRKEVAEEKETQKKQAEYRRMEEAKVANADDSALGAYDVWGKGGYKGIDIQKETEIKVEETAKSLANGKSKVSFKKKKKPAGGRKNRRTTSADDD